MRLDCVTLKASLVLCLSTLSACQELNLQALEGVNIQGIDLGRLSSAAQHVGEMGEKTQDQEQTIGQASASYLLQKAPLLANAQLQGYVNQVGRWVALQSERPDLDWHFAVLDSPQVGAYAAPGGYVLITSGLLTRLDNEAELAGVLAHEVSHVVQKHHLKALQSQAGTGALSDLALFAAQASQAKSTGAANSQALDLGKQLTQNIADLYSKGLSRGDEYQADALGAVLTARAGYDPYGLASALQSLATGRKDNTGLATFLKVHPNFDDRLTRLEPVYQYIDSKGMSGPTLAERYRLALSKR